MSHLFDVTGRNPVTGRVVKLSLLSDTTTGAMEKGVACGLVDVAVVPRQNDGVRARSDEPPEAPNGD